MDGSNSYLNALKGTANIPRRPPSFPAPPHPSRLPNIPPDLLTEILSHIPIKSLVRFQSVCKSWRDLISDPQFSLSFQNRKLTIRYGEGLYDLNSHSESDKVSMVKLPYPMRKKEIGGTGKVEMPQFKILGSCKGFLLIAEHDVDLYLWNPSIRQCTKVLSLPRPDEDVKYKRRLTGFGLCYDSSNDDYKAVLAYNKAVLAYNGYYDYEYYYEYYDSSSDDYEGNYAYNGYKGITVVASLKSRRWTTFRLPYKLINSGATVNDRLHWVVKKRYENGIQFPTQQIICFDPLVDEFREISIPLPRNGGRSVAFELGVLDGCLCLMRNCYDESGYMDYDNKSDIEVLVMKEYGVEESWISLFVVSLHGRRSNNYGCGSFTFRRGVPLCLTKKEKVIAVNGECMLLYNPMEDSWKYFTDLRSLFAYEESLVSPNLYGRGYDWRIGRVDAWNMVYDDHRDRGRKYWCQCCDYVPSWDDIDDFWEENYDRTYSWEEDFLEKGKERLRMRIKNQNYGKGIEKEEDW